jgi:hypothetical protein
LHDNFLLFGKDSNEIAVMGSNLAEDRKLFRSGSVGEFGKAWEAESRKAGEAFDVPAGVDDIPPGAWISEACRDANR